MTKRSVEHLELQQLLSALCDGELDEAGRGRLYEILEEDPAARRFYIDYLDLDASLRWDWAEPEVAAVAPVEATRDETARGARPGVPGTIGEVLGHGFSLLSRSNVFAVLVAVGLPAFVLLILVLGVMTEAPPKGAVASIMRVHDCVGELGERRLPLADGLHVFPGQRLSISEGLVEIQFATGARTILEAPATFEVCDGNAGYLVDGRLSARVPRAAHGFAVGTPLATIIDLGTEFGVSVDADGVAEAHVFDGEVEVVAKKAREGTAGAIERVEAGEAVEVSIDVPGGVPRIQTIAASDSKFVRHVPGTLAEPTVVFAHRGSVDPTREGWKLIWNSGSHTDMVMGPSVEDGEPSWMIRGPDDQWCYYEIRKEDGLNPKLVAEAKRKGWVMRVRVLVSDESPLPKEGLFGLSRFSYRGGGRSFVLHPTLNERREQCVVLCEDSSLGNDAIVPVPGSRNRFVDYEIRYRPETETADVYVNGRRVATDFGNVKVGGKPGICFGKWKLASEARFAMVEWGILKDPPAAEAGGGERTGGE